MTSPMQLPITSLVYTFTKLAASMVRESTCHVPCRRGKVQDGYLRSDACEYTDRLRHNSRHGEAHSYVAAMQAGKGPAVGVTWMTAPVNQHAAVATEILRTQHQTHSGELKGFAGDCNCCSCTVHSRRCCRHLGTQGVPGTNGSCGARACSVTDAIVLLVRVVPRTVSVTGKTRVCDLCG